MTVFICIICRSSKSYYTPINKNEIHLNFIPNFLYGVQFICEAIELDKVGHSVVNLYFRNKTILYLMIKTP